MKHYTKNPEIFNGYPLSIEDKTWMLISADGSECKIEICELRDEEVLSLVFHFRKLRHDLLHDCQKILQVNNLDSTHKNPEKFLLEPGLSSYLKNQAEFKESVSWLSIVTTECVKRGLDKDLNADL